MESTVVSDLVEYSTVDGVIGLLMLVAGMILFSLVAMWSSTALITYSWMTGKSKNPIVLVFRSYVIPMFTTLWSK